jgi:ribosome biogenesis GTPase
MKLTVYKSTGSWYIVHNDEGKIFNARIKGKLKIDGITSTNPIAVGDIVEAEMENEEENSLIISSIDQRRNYITRTSPHNKHQHHIIASNLDQSLLFATLKDPKTSNGFMDRFLITSEAYQIPSIIVFNKTDIYGEKEDAIFIEMKEMYEKIGYKAVRMSTVTGEGIEAIKLLMKDKVTLVSGHSGVGKSSFINIVFPLLHIKTQEVSDWSGKGLHTTTFAEMFDLPFGGKIIDTPGIRELGLVDIPKKELAHYFPEMRKLMNNCQFNDCMHINEPGCAIKEAVADNSISMERYVSYCNILDSIDDKKY